MRKIPNFSLLRTFELAARFQSFALAAKELHLTPSAVSHQVHKLEQYLDCQLFNRNHQQVEITVTGHRLLNRLSTILDELESLCGEVNTTQNQKHNLAIHCSPSFASKWLSKRLFGFKTLCPDITTRFTSNADPINILWDTKIDVAISYGFAQKLSGVEVISLGEEAIVPMCSPALIDESLAIADYFNLSTLIESQLCPVSWRDWFIQNKLKIPDSVGSGPSFDRASLAIAAAVDGMGIALESTRFAEEELNQGKLVQLGGDRFMPIKKELHFISIRVTDQNLPKITAFRNWILSELAILN